MGILHLEWVLILKIVREVWSDLIGTVSEEEVCKIIGDCVIECYEQVNKGIYENKKYNTSARIGSFIDESFISIQDGPASIFPSDNPTAFDMQMFESKIEFTKLS